MSLKLVSLSIPDFMALSSDIDGDNKIPGLGIVGAKVFITDTQVWKIVLPDLTLADFIFP